MDVNGNEHVDPDEIVVRDAGALRHGRPTYLLGSRHEQIRRSALEVAPGTTSPYTDQFNISLQHQLANDLAIEFSYIYKTDKDFLVLQPYDLATGEFFEWESLPYTTWTGYETEVWQIVVEDFNGDGVIDGADCEVPVATTPTAAGGRSTPLGGRPETSDRTYTGPPARAQQALLQPVAGDGGDQLEQDRRLLPAGRRPELVHRRPADHGHAVRQHR